MWLKKIMVWAVVVSLLFTAGCGAKETDGKAALGRFVEEVLDYPEEGSYVIGQILNNDGSLGVYLYGDEGNEPNLYHTKDGKKWEMQEIPWSLAEEEIVLDIARGPKGESYLLTTTYQGNIANAFIYKVEDNGTLRKIPVDWQLGDMAEYGVMARQIAVLDNGDLLVEQAFSGVVQYGQDGSYKRTYEAAAESGSFTAAGNQIYLWDNNANAVLVYDGDTFEQVKSLNFENSAREVGLASGQNGVIYLYNSSGLFRLMTEGTMFEKIIDGELSSLSLPTFSFSDLVETPEGVIYLKGSEGLSSQLYRYQYDEKVAARPSEELTVYTLYENQMLRQAATYYNQHYPQVKVNIQVGMSKGNAAEREVLQALNTELLGGKGPDILLLDGMNVENYIDKGVLADITDLVADLSRQSPMIEPVVKSWERDGKLYAVPTRFLMPVYYTKEVNQAEMQSLDTLTAFAKNHPEKGIIGNKTGKNLMKVFMAANGQAWISKEGIDEAKLKGYLEAVKTMADTEAKAYVPEVNDQQTKLSASDGVPKSLASWGNEQDSLFDWVYGRAHGSADLLYGFDSFTAGNLGLEKLADGGVDYLPGDVAGAFIPSDIAGMNVNSQKKDLAENFFTLLLSPELQMVDFVRGFAVNIEGLNQGMQKREEIYFTMSNASRPEEELSGGWPSIQAQEKIRDLCLAVKTPYTLDAVLTEMILDEAEGYFTGQKTVDQTVKDIKERTRIYLSE